MNHVLVLMGGISTEREVSLKSGAAVANALKEAGYKVDTLDINYDNIEEIRKINPDVVYIALHGKGGEDGNIQGLLEWMNIPYTGPGVASSAVCMNKILTKKLMCYSGIPTPKFLEFDDSADENITAEKIIDELGIPVVLKASCQGSSIGVEIVKDKEALKIKLKELKKYGDTILAEQFVDGCEVTVPIFGNRDCTVLPIIEILSENEFYDYQSKYTQGMSHHIIPARIDEKVAEEIRKIAISAYKAADCRGLSRIDFIIDKNNQPYFIEVNTLPGMTDVSLFPEAAKEYGISFPELVDIIVKLALEK